MNNASNDYLSHRVFESKSKTRRGHVCGPLCSAEQWPSDSLKNQRRNNHVSVELFHDIQMWVALFKVRRSIEFNRRRV